jgi:hypothetical protein
VRGAWFGTAMAKPLPPFLRGCAVLPLPAMANLVRTVSLLDEETAALRPASSRGPWCVAACSGEQRPPSARRPLLLALKKARQQVPSRLRFMSTSSLADVGGAAVAVMAADSPSLGGAAVAHGVQPLTGMAGADALVGDVLTVAVETELNGEAGRGEAEDAGVEVGLASATAEAPSVARPASAACAGGTGSAGAATEPLHRCASSGAGAAWWREQREDIDGPLSVHLCLSPARRLIRGNKGEEEARALPTNLVCRGETIRGAVRSCVLPTPSVSGPRVARCSGGELGWARPFGEGGEDDGLCHASPPSAERLQQLRRRYTPWPWPQLLPLEPNAAAAPAAAARATGPATPSGRPDAPDGRGTPPSKCVCLSGMGCFDSRLGRTALRVVTGPPASLDDGRCSARRSGAGHVQRSASPSGGLACAQGGWPSLEAARPHSLRARGDVHLGDGGRVPASAALWVQQEVRRRAADVCRAAGVCTRCRTIMWRGNVLPHFWQNANPSRKRMPSGTWGDPLWKASMGRLARSRMRRH